MMSASVADPDPDPDPGFNKWPNVNFFGVCKSHKSLFLKFLGHDYTFYNIFPPKKKFRRNWAENLFRSGSGSGRFRIRSGQKLSESATLISTYFLPLFYFYFPLLYIYPLLTLCCVYSTFKECSLTN
jgi:hypothetical protein